MAMPSASPLGPHAVAARLSVPAQPRALVVLVRVGMSTELGRRYAHAAACFQSWSFATLLLDPLNHEEASRDPASQYDVELLSTRVVAALSRAAMLPGVAGLPLGCWGGGTAAAAALAAAAQLPDMVSAVVSCSGRPDLVDAATLAFVHAPVLLIVGERDREIIALNHFAISHLHNVQINVIPDAMRLFYDARAFEAASRLAGAFFDLHLGQAAGRSLER